MLLGPCLTRTKYFLIEEIKRSYRRVVENMNKSRGKYCDFSSKETDITSHLQSSTMTCYSVPSPLFLLRPESPNQTAYIQHSNMTITRRQALSRSSGLSQTHCVAQAAFKPMVLCFCLNISGAGYQTCTSLTNKRNSSGTTVTADNMQAVKFPT